jgi:hypothetical protein
MESFIQEFPVSQLTAYLHEEVYFWDTESCSASQDTTFCYGAED